MKQLIIGVDFDGTLVTENFPEIGELKQETVNFIFRAKELGHKIIIWTARSGVKAIEACDFLIENNIPFDFFNENHDCEYYQRGEQGRKLFCDIYLDDRAVNINDIFKVNTIIENPTYKPTDKVLGVTLDDIYYHSEVLIEGGTEVEIIRVNEDDSITIINLSTFTAATVRKELVSLPLGLV